MRDAAVQAELDQATAEIRESLLVLGVDTQDANDLHVLRATSLAVASILDSEPFAPLTALRKVRVFIECIGEMG